MDGATPRLSKQLFGITPFPTCVSIDFLDLPAPIQSFVSHVDFHAVLSHIANAGESMAGSINVKLADGEVPGHRRAPFPTDRRVSPQGPSAYIFLIFRARFPQICASVRLTIHIRFRTTTNWLATSRQSILLSFAEHNRERYIWQHTRN